MALRKYFWRNYLASGFVFLALLLALVLINRPEIIHNTLVKLGLKTPESYDIAHSVSFTDYPEIILPEPSTYGSWVEKPNYVLFYDQDIMQARFTLHKLTASDTRGEASRYGVRFDENELIGLSTAAYRDYSGSGYDRGHLVPAGDFRCCQSLMEETFGMSNIAPFDSLLNRYAWTELELKTRSWARRFGEVYVITGPIFENRLNYFGRYNDICVPTHFFKLVFRMNRNTKEPQESIAFVLPNEPTLHFDVEKFRVSIDQLEELTEMDFFALLQDVKETKLESSKVNGRW
ncbi:DNA/RNA non-specific endonuclease [Jiulongibacter sp. NS-SX5]|uniref:DNA/RNA non-specific endonuclease n=1 Tax=Jiulongibacter sp. NS-SX5 TaxID=3463854 RepID=UPI004059FB4A